jgi:[acyl-carrier-protein] S-malonyltransferase
MSGHGITELVECGPGKVLSGLNKRCVKGVNTYCLETPDAFSAARAALC